VDGVSAGELGGESLCGRRSPSTTAVGVSAAAGSWGSPKEFWPGRFLRGRQASRFRADDSYLVDSASSHMLVSKIKPCMSKYKQTQSETANGSLYKLSFI
jgi:hypothetical protein